MICLVVAALVALQTGIADRDTLAPAGVQPMRAEGKVRTDTLWSQSLGVRKAVVVYLPPSYDRDSGRRYPVAYYLHGLWGAEWNWARVGQLPQAMDSLVQAGGREMIVVMPDGDDGWYTTWNRLVEYGRCQRTPPAKESAVTYCVPWARYDDYVARDVVAWADSAFRTVRARESRAIAGLSMGGYGAVTIALAYPDVFAVAASHSGVLSPLLLSGSGRSARYGANTAELRTRWGSIWTNTREVFGSDTVSWWARDPGRLASRLAQRAPANMPRLYIDVGTADRMLAQNDDFHASLDRLGISHVYHRWPGAHDWRYWRTHVPESLAWIGSSLR